MNGKPRECAECSLCCVVMGVKSIGKPAGVRCKYLGPKGCSIYATRPKECRDFDCIWLQGTAIPANLKPSKSGVVIGANDRGTIPVFYVNPSNPKAWKKGKFGRYLRSKPFKKIPVFVGERLTIYQNQGD